MCHRLEPRHSGECSNTLASHNYSQHHRITRGIASQWALQGLSRSRISQGVPQSGHQQRLRSLITTLACSSDLYLAKRATSYSKATSVHSGASSGYQEIDFDSKSVNSVGSNASAASATSGRRGPLTDWARAKMNAVKKVGACWKCKFTRKTVSLE